MYRCVYIWRKKLCRCFICHQSILCQWACVFFLCTLTFDNNKKVFVSEKVKKNKGRQENMKKQLALLRRLSFCFEILNIVAPLWHDFMLNGLEIEMNDYHVCVCVCVLWHVTHHTETKDLLFKCLSFSFFFVCIGDFFCANVIYINKMIIVSNFESTFRTRELLFVPHTVAFRKWEI